MKIKKMREQHGVTQVELAYATGIGRFKLFLFEKGYQEPSKQEVADFRRLTDPNFVALTELVGV